MTQAKKSVHYFKMVDDIVRDATSKGRGLTPCQVSLLKALARFKVRNDERRPAAMRLLQGMTWNKRGQPYSERYCQDQWADLEKRGYVGSYERRDRQGYNAPSVRFFVAPDNRVVSSARRVAKSGLSAVERQNRAKVNRWARQCVRYHYPQEAAKFAFWYANEPPPEFPALVPAVIPAVGQSAGEALRVHRQSQPVGLQVRDVIAEARERMARRE